MTAPQTPVTCLLLAYDQSFRRDVAAALASRHIIATDTGDTYAALHLLTNHRYDVVIVDASEPGDYSAALIARRTTDNSTTPFLVLTSDEGMSRPKAAESAEMCLDRDGAKPERIAEIAADMVTHPNRYPGVFD